MPLIELAADAHVALKVVELQALLEENSNQTQDELAARLMIVEHFQYLPCIEKRVFG